MPKTKKSVRTEIKNQDFVKFLKSHRAYKEYLRELDRAPFSIEYLNTKCESIYYISGIITWRYTNKGQAYWSKLNKKWRGELNAKAKS